MLTIAQGEPIQIFRNRLVLVTTLASRRQNLLLKRLRSIAAGDGEILAGSLLPVTAITVLQVTVVLVALTVFAGGEADPLLLSVAVLSTVVMMLGLGLATAGVSDSPDHAQVTTSPLLVGTLAVSGWVGFTGTEELTLLKRLLPGGSASELIVNAWNGGLPLGDSLWLLAPTLVWVVVALLTATRLLRWEPRR